MNEQQLLEAQLAREQAHLMEIAAALHRRIISDEFTAACVHYLMFMESLERARARTLLERAPDAVAGTVTADSVAVDAMAAAAATARLQAALARSLGAPAPSRRPGPADLRTLEMPDSAEPHDAPAEVAQRAAYTRQLLEARLALEACLEASYSLEDRRAVAHLDADSILEERRLYREVLRHGLEPSGV